jgi:hypothetical protein
LQQGSEVIILKDREELTDQRAEGILRFNQSNYDVIHHTNRDGLKPREFAFNHDEKMYYIRVENQLTGSVNQLNFLAAEIR